MFFFSLEARKFYSSPATKSIPSCSPLVVTVAHALVRAASRLLSMLGFGLSSHLNKASRPISIPQPQGRATILPYSACAALNPDDQAHWKLKPPKWPVTSTTSPIKNNPGTLRLSIVFAESSSVSTPPAVTSALA